MTPSDVLYSSLRQRPLTPARIFVALIVVILWIGFTILVYRFSQSGIFGVIDFDVYYRSALALREGASPYQGITDMVYLYPPLLAALLQPFVGIPREILWLIWYSAHILLVAGVITIVQPAFRPRRRIWLWLSPLFFAPIIEGLYIGQISVTLLALFTMSWAAHRAGRPGLCGALLALATWLKVYPVLVILLFVWWRDWRTVRAALIAGFALAFIQIVMVGWQTFIESFGILFSLNAAGQEYRTSLNASVTGFTHQLFGDYPRVQPLLVSPLFKSISRYGLSGVLVMVAAWMMRIRVPRPRVRTPAQFDISYSLAILTALLISPTLWVSGMPPLLLCIWLVWRHLPPARRMSVIHWFLLIIYFVVTIYYLFILGYTGEPSLSGLVLSFGFYALLLLWGIHVVLLRKVTEEQS